MTDGTEGTERTDYASEDWLSILVIEGEEEAELIQGFLENEGIPCQIESKYSHEFPTHVGQLAEVDVRVPESRAEEARRALARREAAYEAAPDAGE
ncbi:MAG TPA: DUF2007 domain-containing protein [Thermoanaerobaculia bacterium]